MKYYPIHMHLHCSHEPSASLGSHMSHAAALGIRHIWTTEHDTRMGKKKSDIPVFAFPEKQLSVTLANGVVAGFLEEEGNDGAYAFEEDTQGVALRISALQGQRESLTFYSKGKTHCDALFAGLTVQMQATLCGNVRVEYILSAQPPTYKQAKLCYVLGQTPQKDDGAPVQYLPFPEKTDGAYTFPITKDAGEEVGGLDNALCAIRIVVENGGEMVFRSFAFQRERNFEQVRQEQIKLAKRLGEKWGVTAFVGFEITGAGNHKNCFSTQVPVIDYAAHGYAVSNEQAIEHVKKYGGIFSWNHPYTVYANSALSKDEIKQELKEKLLSTRVYGASLIEVGFPCGRDGFEEKDYLWLWDRLSENGIFITGDGDSDNHHAKPEGWTCQNNFCTFAGMYDDEPPTEENFVKAFKRGSVWAGDPTRIKALTFGSGDKPQGSVLRGKKVGVEWSVKGLPCEGYVVCIVNGNEVCRKTIENGNGEGKFDLPHTQTYNFARVEVYDRENVLIAFSNPVYLVDENAPVKERS